MHNRRNINSHTVNEGPISFSRAVVSDGLIFVSATSGHDYARGTLSPSIEEQADQALSNISAALAGAGAYMKDVVRVRYLIPDRTEFDRTFPILQKWFGDAKPAATVMICGLYEEGVKIEIEVTARRSTCVFGNGTRDAFREGNQGIASFLTTNNPTRHYEQTKAAELLKHLRTEAT